MCTEVLLKKITLGIRVSVFKWKHITIHIKHQNIKNPLIFYRVMWVWNTIRKERYQQYVRKLSQKIMWLVGYERYAHLLQTRPKRTGIFIKIVTRPATALHAWVSIRIWNFLSHFFSHVVFLNVTNSLTDTDTDLILFLFFDFSSEEILLPLKLWRYCELFY